MGAYDCDCINNLEYDRRERKAQLSKEGATSDLISRTATIDAVNNAFDRETLLTGLVRSIAVRAIRDMPTIQPVATDTNVGDTIRRQQAIDVLLLGKEMLSRVLDDMDVVGTDREKYSWGLGLIESYINDIKELPSAQPEPQWIPVERELPEEPGYYITSNEYNGVGEDFYYDGHFWNADKNAYSVIAWMPKPEHYKPNK